MAGLPRRIVKVSFIMIGLIFASWCSKIIFVHFSHVLWWNRFHLIVLQTKFHALMWFFFFRLSEFFFYQLLTRLDIGAGIDQPSGCLIVQNCQAV